MGLGTADGASEVISRNDPGADRAGEPGRRVCDGDVERLQRVHFNFMAAAPEETCLSAVPQHNNFIPAVLT